MNNDQKLYVLDRLYTALEGANCKEMKIIWTHKIREFENRNGGLRDDKKNKREA